MVLGIPKRGDGGDDTGADEVTTTFNVPETTIHPIEGHTFRPTTPAYHGDQCALPLKPSHDLNMSLGFQFG